MQFQPYHFISGGKMITEPKKYADLDTENWVEEITGHDDGNWEFRNQNDEWSHLVTIDLEDSVLNGQLS